MALDILRNAISFVDGRKISSSTTLMLPKIKLKTEKENFGGSDGEGEYVYGLQAMEAKIKVGALEPGILRITALAPGIRKTFRINGAYVGEDGSTHSARARITGSIADLDAGDWKHGSKSDWDHRIIVKTYKLTIDDEVIFDIDPENFIRVIDGKDQLAQIRAALEME